MRRPASLLLLLTLVSRDAPAQAIDTATALGGLRDAAASCKADGGALWGRSLCGPVALADRQTRLLITNDSGFGQRFLRYGDAFVTTAPANTGFANTSFAWAGRQWAMIMLPLPADRFDRIALLMHEVFHREQAALGLAGMDPPNNQLDQTQGRRWLRLELNALASALDALSSNEAAAREHARNALLLRARRRELYPLADSLEPVLEMQEGLPEYTGVTLAMAATGQTPARVARRVREFQSSPTYVRSFAYATGPALGVLLDHFAPDWKREIGQVRDPALLLGRQLKVVAPSNLATVAERAARAYDVARIDREEAARDSLRRASLAGYRARLVDGPVLLLEQAGIGRTFDPNALIGFDLRNTLYPTGSFSAEWGSVEVTGGALLSNDFRRLQLPAPSQPPAPGDRRIAGDGWTLSLNAGWSVVPDGSRAGSYVARRAP